MLDLNNHFETYTGETHARWGEHREDYHSAAMSQDQLAVPSSRLFKVFKGQIWKRRLHSSLGQQKMQSWLQRRDSLTGTECLHRAAQVELWLLREETLEEQKQGAGIAAASPALQGLAPRPVPARGGSRARPQPLPPGRPLLHRGGCTTCPKPLGQKVGAASPCRCRKPTQRHSIAGGGRGRMN